MNEGPKREFGTHYLVEYSGCDAERIKFVDDVRAVLIHAADKSRATMLEHYFHQFDPHGVTGIIMIAESHFSVHTWPEDGYAAFDVLTCGDMDADVAIQLIGEGFAAQEVSVQEIKRGF